MTSRSSFQVEHVVIIAGGEGTRAGPLADNIPKVLLSVGDKPILQHQLELAAKAGVTSATIFAGHLADPIDRFVGDGSKFGLRVRTVVERELLGTAGALLQSLDSLPEHFFVLYGDLMLAVDLRRMASAHIARRADFTALVHPNDHPHDSDLLESDANDWVTTIHNCPHPPDQFFGNQVNAAVHVVRRDALRGRWSGTGGKLDFARDVMPGLLKDEQRVLAYRTSEYVKDMGTPERLERVRADWKRGIIGVPGCDRNRPAVFLDRDGTLNVEKCVLCVPEELDLLADVGLALRSLREAGYLLVVLTNQPVIARGEATEEQVEAIHRRLQWELGKRGAYLDAIYLCPHHPDRGFPGERPELKRECKCRKPGTALFERACEDLAVDAAASWMVGDRTLDMEMARSAGLRSILVQTGAAGQDGKFEAAPDHVAADLAGAANVILDQHEIAAR